MPRIKSAKKRMRQTEKRSGRNRVRKERLKKAVKSFQTAIAKAEKPAVSEGLKKVSKALDKAGVKGVLHKNAVSRRKSRLAKLANKAMTA